MLDDLKHDFVLYLPGNTIVCVWSKLVLATDENGKKFKSSKSSLLTFLVSSRRFKRFAREIDNRPLSGCNRYFSNNHSDRLCLFPINERTKKRSERGGLVNNHTELTGTWLSALSARRGRHLDRCEFSELSNGQTKNTIETLIYF